MTNQDFTKFWEGAEQEKLYQPKRLRIIAWIYEAGLEVVNARRTRLTKKDARVFYEEHKGKEFFEELIKFMTSDYIFVAVLEGEDCISLYRKLIGNTDPSKAQVESKYQTIRGFYGTSVQKNAVHGSDSKKSAKREINLFFN